MKLPAEVSNQLWVVMSVHFLSLSLSLFTQDCRRFTPFVLQLWQHVLIKTVHIVSWFGSLGIQPIMDCHVRTFVSSLSLSSIKIAGKTLSSYNDAAIKRKKAYTKVSLLFPTLVIWQLKQANTKTSGTSNSVGCPSTKKKWQVNLDEGSLHMMRVH